MYIAAGYQYNDNPNWVFSEGQTIASFAPVDDYTAIIELDLPYAAGVTTFTPVANDPAITILETLQTLCPTPVLIRAI